MFENKRISRQERLKGRAFGLQRTSIEATFSSLGAKDLSQFTPETSRGEDVHVERDGEWNVVECDGDGGDESLFDFRSSRGRRGLVRHEQREVDQTTRVETGEYHADEHIAH